MSKATIKQVLKTMSVLQDNLPKEEIEEIDSEILQKIVDFPQISGREFMSFLKNGARVQVIGNHIINCDTVPFIPSGLSVEEHRRTGNLVWDLNKVSLYLSKNQKKNWKTIEGDELREELKNKSVLNANVLDYLVGHPELIPEEWKKKLIFFWGTIYRDLDSSLYVRYLYWYRAGRKWSWDFHWLGHVLDDSCPAVFSASV